MALTDKLTAIGDAIRAKTKTTELIPLAEMSAKVDDVYEAGKKAEYDRFWDSYQINGTRTSYETAFAGYNGWDKYNFYPKYDIRPVGSSARIFYAWEKTGRHDRLDLTQRLEECGVVLDTSQATSLYGAFGYSHFLRIPAIDLTGITATDGAHLLFAHSWDYLHTIDKIIVNENTKFGSTFYNCTALVNLIFEGTLAQNGLYVNTCINLSHDSLMSILNSLKDYSNDTSGTSWVVTLGTENLAKLTDAEKAIATQKGWSLA